MEFIKQILDSALPDSFDPMKYFMGLLIGIIGILIVAGIFRLASGKGSVVNNGIASAIVIFCFYLTIMVIGSFSNMHLLFSPLPFVSVSGGSVVIFPIIGATFRSICTHCVNMIILCYLMNLLETWLPNGNKIWSWFCFRFIALSLAICLHYSVGLLLSNVLQPSTMEILPVITVSVLAAAFLLACMKLIASGPLSFLNGFLGLFHKFFFKQEVGKQLLRAIITTILLTALVSVLNYISFTSIALASVAALTYLPIIIIGLILWHVIEQYL